MSDQLNDKNDAGAHGSTHHHDESVDTNRVVNEEDSGSYTDVDLTEPELKEDDAASTSTGLTSDELDGHYTDNDDLNVDRS